MGIPFAPEGAPAQSPAPAVHPGCAECRACQRACPVQAIRESGGIDRDLCLQAYMSDMRPVPDSVKNAWGRRFYGCDECLRACPLANGVHACPLSAEEEKIGLVGDRVDLRSVMDADDAELAKRFKGSALGLSWLDARTLRKNAALALHSWSAEEQPMGGTGSNT